MREYVYGQRVPMAGRDGAETVDCLPDIGRWRSIPSLAHPRQCACREASIVCAHNTQDDGGGEIGTTSRRVLSTKMPYRKVEVCNVMDVKDVIRELSTVCATELTFTVWQTYWSSRQPTQPRRPNNTNMLIYTRIECMECVKGSVLQSFSACPSVSGGGVGVVPFYSRCYNTRNDKWRWLLSHECVCVCGLEIDSSSNYIPFDFACRPTQCQNGQTHPMRPPINNAYRMIVPASPANMPGLSIQSPP